MLEYAVISCSGERLSLEDLPEWFESAFVSGEPKDWAEIAEVHIGYDYQRTMAQFERDYLKKMLDQNQGRLNRTARMIGLNKTTFLRKVRAHGLTEPNLAASAQ